MSRNVAKSFVVVAALSLAGSGVAAGQVELDRSLSRVYATTVMSSDVRQAKMLRLVPDAATASDTAVWVALENRLLMLRETANNERLEPSKDAIATARDAWRRGWPEGENLPALMTRAGMTDQALDGWFRDELRINAYINQRFGQVPDRATRISSWLSDLRRRANLPITR
jgi:hypothetical protein